MSRARSTALLATSLAAALLAATAAPAPAQYRGFGKNKVQYREFDWRIYHSPHFDVYYYTAEEHLLDKVVSFAESAYDQLSREFDYQIQEPTPLIFYDTHSAFEQNNIILNFIPEGVAAFASPARNRMVLPVDMPDPELMALILHELTHIFQYHILFQGSLSKAATLRPPQWFMEGMASYMAKDEEAHDKMVLRDAVVNDNIPRMTEEGGGPSGYFAYRIGHALFDYIEERWGREGFLDFIYEMRNTIGARPGRAVQRAFRIDPEDFDLDFRRWLRKRYLRQLVETGEPSDFGRPFRVEDQPNTQELSPVASPSGDLVAAVSLQRGDLDVVLFDARRRRQIRNLTRGISTQYRYLVVQGVTVGRRMGRDLAFSPDGNHLAVFARKEGGRSLLLLDVLNGGVTRTIDMEIEQQVGLDWSPDGRTIAFSGNRDGRFDIYLLDLESGEVTPLTDDPVFDGAPTFSPDGTSLVFASVVGGHAKLFRVELEQPDHRYQLTFGESSDRDPIYSPDGRRVYYTSDRDGFDNVFGLDLENGELRQFTDVVTGSFMPAVVAREEGREDLVYTGYWDGTFKLFLTDLEEPVSEPQIVEAAATTPTTSAELPRFEPAIEVAIDEGNVEGYRGFKFFLENAETYVGVDDDQTFLGQVYLTFSDYLGDHRIIAVLSSYDALSNFNVAYWDLSDRLQWGVNLFDERDFLFVARDPATGRVLDRRNEIRQTGLLARMTYPFGFKSRVEAGAGWIYRKFDFDIPALGPGGDIVFNRLELEEDFPWFQAALVRDAAVFAPWGPVSGQRWRIDGNVAPDLDDSGVITSELSGDFRQYLPVTLRSGFAFRLFAGARWGNDPTPIYIGGENIRSFRFRSLTGDRAAFTNLEFRFPLIDFLATPVLRFQGIRGRVFLDVGGVWFEDQGFFLPEGGIEIGEFDFWNDEENRLEDGVAVYGFGFTLRFLGLDLNWDFGKRWDFKETVTDGFETTFYIGTRF